MVLGIGMVVAGCKSAPPLSNEQALSLIQAKYDAAQPTGIDITVNNDGMVQGATAKYWNRKTIYPNKYWADFVLTPDGKKLVKLPDGTDVIKWRPSSPTDPSFTIVVTTLLKNTPKARDIKSIQDAVGGGKTVTFTEGVDLSGLPDALQSIAHNPGNILSNTRQADFVLENGAWKVQSIE